MSIIKGAQVAEAVSAETLKRAEALRLKGIEPCLAVIRVGEDGSQLAYERGVSGTACNYGKGCGNT